MCCGELSYSLFGFSSDVKLAEPWPRAFQTVTSVKETPPGSWMAARCSAHAPNLGGHFGLVAYFFDRGEPCGALCVLRQGHVPNEAEQVTFEN